MPIQVYVRSIGYVTDPRGQIGVTHPYAIPQLENTFVSTRRLDDVLYEAESAQLLEVIARLADDLATPVQVIDVSRLRGRLQAWRQGVRQTPTLRKAGRLYEGREAAEKALLECVPSPHNQL